ncbi:hypothetical protein Ddye_004516 [Dipteronia dyeriana]|uniref:HMA domain-containing protein n=1 Tax=Dipteronia dyeriana TaxID=168575 RepID=A0AAD9XVX4_9ROSI|nr:hypothetical protein Ddye_004516 [Dipteronia dyeriana]
MLFKLFKKTKINIDDVGEGDADNNGQQCPLPTVVVLMVWLRSQDSIDKIHKLVRGFKGVKETSMAKQKQQVIVMGTMDSQALVEYLKKKLKRTVEIVPPMNDKESTTDDGFKFNARNFHANIPCLPRKGMG